MVANGNSSLPEHYERHFGPISQGWSDENATHGVQIVSFDDQPQPGVRTYATLGLSDHLLNLPKGRRIRQELLVCADDAASNDKVAAFLLSFAEHVLTRGAALLRGEVVGPSTSVIPGSTANAIYVTNPSPFADSLVQFEGPEPPIVFAYLVPITSQEAALIHERGWSWFEVQLEEQNPDIWNLARSEEIVAR